MKNLGITLERKKYLKEKKQAKCMVLITQIAILVIFLGVWEILAQKGIIDSFLMSQPSRILKTFLHLTDNNLLMHIGVTVYETVVGFLLGTILGIAIAIALWWAISLIVSVLENLNGFLKTDKEIIKMAKTFNSSKFQILVKIVIPANLSTFINSLKVNIGLSLVGVISGEFLVSKAGLGYLIVYGGQVFQLDLVMTSVIILGIVAGVMYLGVMILEKIIKRKITGTTEQK